jgi:hypothetical protein
MTSDNGPMKRTLYRSRALQGLRGGEGGDDERRPLDACRLRAVLALRGVGIEAFARALLRPVSYRYLASICSGERVPSAELLDALREALGPDSWAFVTGACDTLTAPRIGAHLREAPL